MAWPRVIVIESGSDGVYLDRFTAQGDSCGDTWHMSVPDAQQQAVAEYGGTISEWRPVSAELPIDAVIEQALAEFLD